MSFSTEILRNNGRKVNRMIQQRAYHRKLDWNRKKINISQSSERKAQAILIGVHNWFLPVYKWLCRIYSTTKTRLHLGVVMACVLQWPKQPYRIALSKPKIKPCPTDNWAEVRRNPVSKSQIQSSGQQLDPRHHLLNFREVQSTNEGKKRQLTSQKVHQMGTTVE